jgi:hypothetical protein
VFSAEAGPASVLREPLLLERGVYVDEPRLDHSRYFLWRVSAFQHDSLLTDR